LNPLKPFLKKKERMNVMKYFFSVQIYETLNTTYRFVNAIHCKEIISYTFLLGLTFFYKYHILLSIMHIRVWCAPEFHNDFWQKKYFHFSRIISQELIIASLFIINAIKLYPFSATFHVQCAGNISASFLM